MTTPLAYKITCSDYGAINYFTETTYSSEIGRCNECDSNKIALIVINLRDEYLPEYLNTYVRSDIQPPSKPKDFWDRLLDSL
jgi:hypothetical protein